MSFDPQHFPQIVSTGAIRPGLVRVTREALKAVRDETSKEWHPSNADAELLCSFAEDDVSRDPFERGKGVVRWPNGVSRWIPLSELTERAEQTAMPEAP